eukprot:TRINITY_DN710_c0_g2_i1.p1 TRINITY_DN710_c0_g2~~TRINITY_DN710_c0_g2_i1.p1  ORF type:complete len:104 (-),score=5.23 TRINITY_DN710_c0_g2_i1:82-393(-)
MGEAEQANYGETPTVTISYGQSNPRTIFSDMPQNHTCQFCGYTGITEVHNQIGLMAMLIAGSICFLGFWCGCCLIPFCVPQCKDQVHCCGSCKQPVGKRSLLQ